MKKHMAIFLAPFMLMGTASAAVINTNASDPTGDAITKEHRTHKMNQDVARQSQQLANKPGTFRCWQNGSPILIESSLSLLDPTPKGGFIRGDQILYIYNFDNTFCVYFGD